MKKLIAVSIFILIILLCRIFILEPKHNPSGAMAPTILAGDYLLVYKWPYGHFRIGGLKLSDGKNGENKYKLSRGDIITFKYPKKPAVEFIKRIVALPGDKISYKNKSLIINGAPVSSAIMDEVDYEDRILGKQKVKIVSETNNSYSYNIQITSNANDPGAEIKKTVTVPAGQYFVLGDNRDLSNDSRHFGFVSANEITGTVILVSYSYDSLNKVVRWKRIGGQVH